MKVNIKLGNVNHTIHLGAVVKQKLFSGGSIDTIILGADGTYAQKDSKDSKGTARTLAALTGSIDGTFGHLVDL
jgi:hypothetical protein